MPQRERKLHAALAQIRGSYDFILLDCPPAVGLLTVNALTAADAVLVPIQCEYYALEGLGQLLSTIDLVRDNLNPRLRLAGVLLTMYDARTTLSSDVAAEVRRHLNGTVYETVVPRSVRLAEAPSYGRPIARYSPESRGAQAYAALAEEVLAPPPLGRRSPAGGGGRMTAELRATNGGLGRAWRRSSAARRTAGLGRAAHRGHQPQPVPAAPGVRAGCPGRACREHRRARRAPAHPGHPGPVAIG